MLRRSIYAKKSLNFSQMSPFSHIVAVVFWVMHSDY